MLNVMFSNFCIEYYVFSLLLEKGFVRKNSCIQLVCYVIINDKKDCVIG